MTEAQTESDNPALEEAARELQAASHDAQVAYDCIALGDIDRAHTHALTAKVAAEAAMTALAAAMSQAKPDGGAPADERYSLVIEDGRVVLCAAEPVGVARGLTTLIQLIAAVPSPGPDEIGVPGARILDAPRYAWRGLSLDVARTFFTVEEIRRVIDLLELYKLNALHLHPTRDQAWRLAVRQPAVGRPHARHPAAARPAAGAPLSP